jgi:hypothetical protein
MYVHSLLKVRISFHVHLFQYKINVTVPLEKIYIFYFNVMSPVCLPFYKKFKRKCPSLKLSTTIFWRVGGAGYSATRFSTSHYMDVGVQLHALVALHPGKRLW